MLKLSRRWGRLVDWAVVVVAALYVTLTVGTFVGVGLLLRSAGDIQVSVVGWQLILGYGYGTIRTAVVVWFGMGAWQRLHDKPVNEEHLGG